MWITKKSPPLQLKLDKEKGTNMIDQGLHRGSVPSSSWPLEAVQVGREVPSSPGTGSRRGFPGEQ